MNKTNLKRYAPQARKDFIAAVTARANLLGLSERGGKLQAEPCEVKGDVALIGGRPWPATVQGRRVLVTSVEVRGSIASDGPSSFRAFMRTAPGAAWDEAQTR